MRRLCTFALLAIVVSIAKSQDIDTGTGFIGNGYYRIHNLATQRYIYVTDNKDYYDITHDKEDFQAIQLWKNVEKAIYDPASVVYITQRNDVQYDLTGQGTGVHSLTGYYVNVSKKTDNTYEVSASKDNVTKYLYDGKSSSTAQQGTLGTSGKDISYRRWIVDKIDTNHAINYVGIVNIFFNHCNLQCIYCQNGAISGRSVDAALAHYTDLDAIAREVARLLPHSNGTVGFVTAAHYAHLLPDLVEAIRGLGLAPTFVYNSSGYESVDTLRQLEGLVDVYLPDFKYIDTALAAAYSHAADYPAVALAALREMYYQKGSALPTDDNGIAYRGIIVRHLVLPGQVQNSIDVLNTLADLSTSLHIALMAQYFPPCNNLPDQLNRTLTPAEYEQVTNHFYSTGLHRGWVQDLEAQACYRPDFSAPDPFNPQIQIP